MGLSLADAVSLLAQRGFAIGAETRTDGTNSADSVLAADPAPGTRHAPGTAVALQVASGRNAIPPVTGLSVADASAALIAAGFVPSVEYGGAGEQGVVIASAPAAGTVHPLGTGVALRAPASAPPSATPAPPAPSSSPTPQPSGSATPVVP